MEIDILIDRDLYLIDRKTDSLLDWLANWGGLLDGLSFIGRNMLVSYAGYFLNTMLSSELVRTVPSKNKENKFFKKYGDSKHDLKRSRLRKTLLEDFNKDQRFEPNSFLLSLV